MPREFAAGIYSGNLPQEFAVAICRENLSQEFAVAICRMFFVFVSKSFFLYVSKSCLYERKPFLYVSKTFLFVRFSLLTVFLFVIAVAVMGHRRKRSEAAKAYISTNSCTELSKTQFFPVTIVKEKLIISSFLIGIDSHKTY